jgi:hypothetical protein
MQWVHDDGGRATSGFRGDAGDCVCRAVAIATQRSYLQVYYELADINANMMPTKGRRYVGRRTARNGIHTKDKLFKDYMQSQGFRWIACMGIGTGCKVHLRNDELPAGRLIVSLSKHYSAVIDGVIHVYAREYWYAFAAQVATFRARGNSSVF